jgi:hypothetical protein
MIFRIPSFGEMYGRGVWLSPFLGEHGEFVLVAVTSRKRRIAEELVPTGSDHVAAAERLYDLLDAHEPESRANLRVV